MKAFDTKQRGKRAIMALTLCASIGALALTGCGAAAQTGTEAAEAAAANQTAAVATATNTAAYTASAAAGGLLDGANMFSERDLTQTADTSDAVTYTAADGQDIHITEAGVYVLTGQANDVTVYVEAEDTAKVQLVLDGLNVTNTDFPCIYVRSADKVFVTAVAENSLAVTGAFTADGDTNTDGVIFSRDDLVLNGTGTLTVDSSENGVVSKDDLKVTGGSYVITAGAKALEANDSIRVAGGTLELTAGTDGLHAENEEDDTLGYVYISGGSLTIRAGDDAIHANSAAQIDGGSFDITAAEGIEATYVQINDGVIGISASDDGVNAARKSSAYSPTVEITGGELTVVMGGGDTDGIDSNGDILVSGGVIDVTGRSAFDYDGTARYTGGTIIVNGQQVNAIPNQMMGGGMGGFSGNMRGGMRGGMAGEKSGGMRGGMAGEKSGGTDRM